MTAAGPPRGALPAHQEALRAEMGPAFARYLRAGLARIAAGAPRRGLTGPELATLHAYTTRDLPWGYGPLNRALRSTDPRRRAAAENYRRVLNAALSKLPHYEGTVWRGANLPADVLAGHRVGGTVLYPAFTSASIERATAYGGPHRFRILSLRGKSIGPYAADPGENEVLFAAGTRFQVLGRADRAGGVAFIAMREVGE